MSIYMYVLEYIKKENEILSNLPAVFVIVYLYSFNKSPVFLMSVASNLLNICPPLL